MNDRELLELAAKAAGMTSDWEWTSDPFFEGLMLTDDEPDSAPQFWNPRTDHGDRYRLARDCKMILDFDGGEVKWQFDGEEYKRAFRFTPGNDAEEADAVINAAAEIGRNMK